MGSPIEDIFIKTEGNICFDENVEFVNSMIKTEVLDNEAGELKYEHFNMNIAHEAQVEPVEEKNEAVVEKLEMGVGDEGMFENNKTQAEFSETIKVKVEKNEFLDPLDVSITKTGFIHSEINIKLETEDDDDNTADERIKNETQIPKAIESSDSTTQSERSAVEKDDPTSIEKGTNDVLPGPSTKITQIDLTSTKNQNFNQETQESTKRDTIHNKPFKCDVCEKSFLLKSNFKQHTLIHAGIKKFECQICKSSFSRKTVLKRHELIHNKEEKIFSCDVCQKTYTDKWNLTAHKRVHTGELFSCQVCQKSFTNKSRLNHHNLIHTDEKSFQCDICDKLFARANNLRQHRRIHTGEKPYECYVCEKSFTLKAHLDAHQRVHTGEKPYSCDVCNISFSHYSGLRYHKKKHKQ